MLVFTLLTAPYKSSSMIYNLARKRAMNATALRDWPSVMSGREKRKSSEENSGILPSRISPKNKSAKPAIDKPLCKSMSL